MASQASNILFPSGPAIDIKTGYLTESYRQFFIRPQFVSLLVASTFATNGKQPQLSYASGGSIPTTAPTLGSYGYTQVQAAQIIALLNNIQAALVANGIMS